VKDFEEWESRGELVLAPKFQRRAVWNDKARSYLIDTILRGKPIPKLFMRQEVSGAGRPTTREIVDGQQRVRTVLEFLKDGFKVSRMHSEDYGGKVFSALGPETQKTILKYEFAVDLLQDMDDGDVYDIFARINTYTEKLTAQELRNAKYFGDFKTSVYSLSKEFVKFLGDNRVFTPKQILRMGEAEFISELLIASEEGVREGKKSVIDGAYALYDNKFPNRRLHEKRFRAVVDTIGECLGGTLPNLEFRATRLLYPLFCAVYHLRFGLPKLTLPRREIRQSDLSKVRNTLEQIDDMVRRFQSDDGGAAIGQADPADVAFYNAYREHWVHAAERIELTRYIARRILAGLK